MKGGKRLLTKQPNNGLLSSYVVSLLSLALCCAMMLGTTYAWFHSSSVSVGNRVETGVFSVTMFNNGVSLAAKPNHQVFSTEVEWKPGTTRIETVELLNTGNLPAACKVDFVLDTATTPQTAKQFSVYVKQGAATAQEQKMTGLELANTKGWVSLGTLDTVMGGNRGLLYSTVDPQSGLEMPLERGERRTFSIALYTEDPSSVMGETVNLYLHLIAEQANLAQQKTA